MKKIISVMLGILISSAIYCQNECKVLLPELAGQYRGGCKKGLADGEGSAKGTDTYQGSFKKGLPHGFGVYSYADGSVYVGNYKKGSKDGYGMLNSINERGDTILSYGLWYVDSLIIPDEAKGLFNVKLNKGVQLIDPKVTMSNIQKDQVWIEFYDGGIIDRSVIVDLVNVSSGKVMDTEDRALNTLIAIDEITEFPFTIDIRYQIQKDQVHMEDCRVILTLFVPGLWEIKFHH
ncbi:MAG: hypothetical protein E4G95_00205 [Bacteroidia bacterium]|nr:MAG: hypothetical protein E4G95_00205 [Bacteroidia bacterium]